MLLAGVIACGMGGSESGTQSHDGGEQKERKGKERKGVWEEVVGKKGVRREVVMGRQEWDLVL